MGNKPADVDKFHGVKDRISGWNLGREVDNLLDELKSKPGADPKTWTPSNLARTLQARPDIAAIVHPAKISSKDIQVYLWRRRQRQEENADRQLMTGSNGKVLMSEVAKRVETIIELSATAELIMPDLQDMNRTVMENINKAVEEDDLSKLKHLKEMAQVIKMYQEMMFKAASLIKGDATLQNIIKAQQLVHRQTVIHGIKPADVPRIIVDSILKLTCPECGNNDWHFQDAVSAFAKYQSSEAGKRIIDVENAPVVEEDDYDQDDPGADKWDKMSHNHFKSGEWKDGIDVPELPQKPMNKKSRRRVQRS